MNAAPPRISVIIPVYNGAAIIGPCLEAVLQQHVPREAYEIIVVDNGSTDTTVAVVRRYPVRLATEPCRSSFAARNTGVRLARGEILAFADADCRPTPQWLPAAVAALEHGSGRIAGRIVHEMCDPTNPWEWYSAAYFLLQDTFVRRGWAATANLVVTRDVFEQIGFFPVEPHGGDKAWGLRATAQRIPLRYSVDASVGHLTRKGFGAIASRLRVVHFHAARVDRQYDPLPFGAQVVRRLRSSLWGLWWIVHASARAQLPVWPACVLVMSWPFLEALKWMSFYQGWRNGRRHRAAFK